MRLRALSLAAILIALPLSYEWFVVNLGPHIVWLAWKAVETMGYIQILGLIGAVIALIPIWLFGNLATAISNRYPGVDGGVIVALTLVFGIGIASIFFGA